MLARARADLEPVYFTGSTLLVAIALAKLNMQPILLDVPDTLHTERLTLRSPRPGDGQAVFEAVVDSLAELRQFPASLPWAVYEPSVESSEAFARTGYTDFTARRGFPFILLLRGTQTVVGCGGIHDPR